MEKVTRSVEIDGTKHALTIEFDRAVPEYGTPEFDALFENDRARAEFMHDAVTKAWRQKVSNQLYVHKTISGVLDFIARYVFKAAPIKGVKLDRSEADVLAEAQAHGIPADRAMAFLASMGAKVKADEVEQDEDADDEQDAA